MIRQSFSFNEQNDEWPQNQINNIEYSSKSELVNDSIRQARSQQRQIDFIKIEIRYCRKFWIC
jgi:antitoxin ParD1/3/4